MLFTKFNIIYLEFQYVMCKASGIFRFIWIFFKIVSILCKLVQIERSVYFIGKSAYSLFLLLVIMSRYTDELKITEWSRSTKD